MKFCIFSLYFLLSSICGLRAQNTDLRLLNYINSAENPGPDKAWRMLTNSANYIDAAVPIGIFIVGLAEHDSELKSKAYTIAASNVVNLGATLALKLAFNRQRPAVAYPAIIYDKVEESGPSFPSGHTSAAFATATSLSLVFPKWYVIAPSFVYAGAVGYSRLYLGVHYPSDVLAGALLGSASAFVTYKTQHWITKRWSKKKIDQ